jgi:putative SOS response-associated peptidase YedK
MCGRFVLKAPVAEIKEWFGTASAPPEAEPRYNVAPTQNVLAVRFNPETRERSLDALRWGLVPIWAKDPSIGNKLINARAETLADKPSFRDAFVKRRCLIPASAFYEWKKPDAPKGTKQPYAIGMANGGLFAFAGLWERWKTPEGDILRSCTIITTEANDTLRPIHDRMPVILGPDAYGTWLGEEEASPEALVALMRPFDPARMRAWPVGSRVGAVANQGEDLMAETQPTVNSA